MIPVMTNIFQYLKPTRTIQTKSDPLLSGWKFVLSLMGLVTPMILNDKESRNALGSLLTQGLKENINQNGSVWVAKSLLGVGPSLHMSLVTIADFRNPLWSRNIEQGF